LHPKSNNCQEGQEMKKALVLLMGMATLAACSGEGNTTVPVACEVGKTENCLKQPDNTPGKKRCIDGAWSACGDFCEVGTPPVVCTT